MKELDKRLKAFIDNIEFAKQKKVLYYIKDEEIELVKELQKQVKNCSIPYVVVPRGTLCDCEDKASKHFVSNWCEDCKKNIV